ncbi:MAG: class I SAM-dependent methyltransferase [Cyclobacteriaceae bacterium]|nr:class I SAM-dependent methyltransferase [Cyclobacteriaceae bacterium]
MSKFFQAKCFIQYWLEAVDEHSLHSPFLFDFYTQVINKKSPSNDDEYIESLRQKLLQNTQGIFVDDPGSGSMVLTGNERAISDIARTSLSTRKSSSLYTRIITYAQARHIVELGTSLGINTLYLAQGDTHVTTFEGSAPIARIARQNFEIAQASNINLVEGNIDTTLPGFLLRTGKLDVIFLDANHRYTPTLKYFGWLINHVHDRTVMIVDDIHASPEMQRAWQTIQVNDRVYASVDLFRCGIVFFDPSLNKQHVVLSF